MDCPRIYILLLSHQPADPIASWTVSFLNTFLNLFYLKIESCSSSWGKANFCQLEGNITSTEHLLKATSRVGSSVYGMSRREVREKFTRNSHYSYCKREATSSITGNLPVFTIFTDIWFKSLCNLLYIIVMRCAYLNCVVKIEMAHTRRLFFLCCHNFCLVLASIGFALTQRMLWSELHGGERVIVVAATLLYVLFLGI
jgi:hypothetical protein